MASVAHCIEMGAEDYLPKPCDPILLRARVSASLRGKRAHDREARLAAQVAENYEKLKDAERMRDDLTGMIVHDLRTPLTSILSGLQDAGDSGRIHRRADRDADHLSGRRADAARNDQRPSRTFPNWKTAR